MPFIGKSTERMPDGRRFVSMRVKFVGVLWVTGILVIVAALILIPVAQNIFREIYTDPDRAETRLETYINRFASYVAEEGLRSDDTAAIARWTRRHRTVYMTVLRDGQETTSTPEGGTSGGGYFSPEVSVEDVFGGSFGSADSIDSATGTVYSVLFADGLCSVAVTDYSYATYADLLTVGGVALAICAYFITVLIWYHRQTRAIVTLAREVEAITSGIPDAPIEADRNDELGMLARDVDIMRNTVIEKMNEQQRAWQANSDLLTSMTHDLRTPLTTLMGYLDLLAAEQESGNLTDEQRVYIRLCEQKAEQIKGLSDQLFLYFWAYNRPDGEQALEPYDAALLLGQLMGDAIPAVEAAGLTVIADLSAIPLGSCLRVRMDCLTRVTDNLFDNLVKYADPAMPVTVSTICKPLSDGQARLGTLILRVENTVAPRTVTSAGTRIGHKTCSHMMELMQGSFTTTDPDVSAGDRYAVELSWPLYTDL